MKKCTLFVSLIVISLLPMAARAQDDTAAQTPACSEPEARQFDFWVGEWAVESQGEVGGHSLISRIHGNCTILEEFDTAPGPYEGKSFNYFDPRDSSWHQVWVDNSGLRLHLTGGYADKKMIMSGDRLGAPQPTIDRITWTDNEDGTVRQEWDVSQDAGVSWKNVFDGLYRPIEEPTE